MPVARDDAGTASVTVNRTEGTFNDGHHVIGAHEEVGSDSFLNSLATADHQSLWLLSDNSFKDGLADGFRSGFTVTDNGVGGDPAFVVTPAFHADAGQSFSFHADAALSASDVSQVTLFHNTGTADTPVWQQVQSLDVSHLGGNYSFDIAHEGDYRVTFMVDNDKGEPGDAKAAVTFDVQSEGFFVSGGHESVTLSNATGYILQNDTAGDGTNTFAFADGTQHDGVTTVQGDHGVLTVDASGHYTYVPNPDSIGDGVDTFHYTLTDATPDTPAATATLTINVGYTINTDGVESLSVGAAPTVLASADVLDTSSGIGGADDSGSALVPGIGEAGAMEVLAANLNAQTDDSVKRMLKAGGGNKNP